MKNLKAKLYAKFGTQINLEDDWVFILQKFIMQHEPYIMNNVGVWFSSLKDLGSLRRTHSI